jgi:hypothetical protein
VEDYFLLRIPESLPALPTQHSLEQQSWSPWKVSSLRALCQSRGCQMML